MHRKAIVIAVAVVAAAGAGAGASASGSAANKAAARSDASSLLARLSLPPGSKRSASAPTSVLSQPGLRPANLNLVDDHAWWIVPGTPRAALAYVAGHRPAGSKVSGAGDGTGYTLEEFSWPAIRGVLSTRTLIVEVAQLADGSTGLRADSQVVWITPRPASDRVPVGTDRVQVTVTRFGRRAQGPLRVTATKRVDRIVRLINSLPAAQPAAIFCPADFGILVRLDFYAGGRDTPVAVAEVDPGGCGQVGLTIGGRQEPELTSAGFPGSGRSPSIPLVAQLESAIGIRLDTAPPAGQ
jgi:hypothetical protein